MLNSIMKFSKFVPTLKTYHFRTVFNPTRIGQQFMFCSVIDLNNKICEKPEFTYQKRCTLSNRLHTIQSSFWTKDLHRQILITSQTLSFSSSSFLSSPSSSSSSPSSSSPPQLSMDKDIQRLSREEELKEYISNCITRELEQQQQKQNQQQQQQEKQGQDQKEHAAPSKKDMAPWWIRWALQYSQSLKPINDFGKTFRGVRSWTTKYDELISQFRGADFMRLSSEILSNDGDNNQQHRIVVLVGPEGIGKSTLMEHILNRNEVHLCHIKLKGCTYSGVDVLIQRLRDCLGLEENMIDTIVKKLLNVASFGIGIGTANNSGSAATLSTSLKQHTEVAEMGLEVERRIENYGLKVFQKSKKKVIFIDDAAELLSLVTNGTGKIDEKSLEYRVVKDLFMWLTYCTECKVVLNASNGFIDELFNKIGISQHIKYCTLNDLTIDETKNYLIGRSKNLKGAPAIDDDLVEKVYEKFGGRISDLRVFSRNPTEHHLQKMSFESEKWCVQLLKSLADNNRCDTIPREYKPIFEYLIQSKNKVQNLDLKSDKSFSKLKYTGDCGQALDEFNEHDSISLNDIISKVHIPEANTTALELIKKLCSSQILHYNPATDEVSFSSPNMRQEIKRLISNGDNKN